MGLIVDPPFVIDDSVDVVTLRTRGKATLRVPVSSLRPVPKIEATAWWTWDASHDLVDAAIASLEAAKTHIYVQYIGGATGVAGLGPAALPGLCDGVSALARAESATRRAVDVITTYLERVEKEGQ